MMNRLGANGRMILLPSGRCITRSCCYQEGGGGIEKKLHHETFDTDYRLMTGLAASSWKTFFLLLLLLDSSMRRKKRRYQEKLLYNHQMGSILPRELIISIFFLFLWKLKCTRIRYISLTALARHHKSDFNVAAFLMLLLSFIICMFRLFILILLPIIQTILTLVNATT